MSRTPEELLSEAMRLPPRQRAALADSLYESVESEMGEPDEVERAWLEEAHRRLERLERGEAELLPLDQIDASVRSLLRS
jgi:putative addiction module component (TIGR02574 family)